MKGYYVNTGYMGYVPGLGTYLFFCNGSGLLRVHKRGGLGVYDYNGNIVSVSIDTILRNIDDATETENYSYDCED